MVETDPNAKAIDATRRRLLQQAMAGAGILAGGLGLWSCGSPRATTGARALDLGALAEAARDRVRVQVGDSEAWIPRGTRLRQVARSGEPVLPGSSYRWHAAPDGGACFATPDGGWIYVSNSEVREAGRGGVGAIRFDPQGEPVDAYGICHGTRANCAGGPTPWQTWLTCEEFDRGRVWECDPTGQASARVLPALGVFKHEAVAVDPVHGRLYLTEDEPDGLLYRFTPDDWPADGRPSLASGLLEALVVAGDPRTGPRPVEWQQVPDPAWSGARPTRAQVSGARRFNGGEGIWYHEGRVYFATKGDNRVWLLDTTEGKLQVVYDRARGSLDPSIADVDNLTVSAAGEVVVAEDGPEMRLVVLGPDMIATPLVDFVGHRDSEICGPAFTPDGSRLYFSSQRGQSGRLEDGRIYELSGLHALT